MTARRAGSPADGGGPPAAAARRVHRTAARVAAGVLGAGMIALPALTVPLPAQGLTGAGLLLVTAGLAGPAARWALPGALAAIASVVLAVAGQPAPAVLAGQGLLMLGYLLLLDTPAGLPRPALAHWLRLQAPPVIWAVVTSAVLLAVLAVTVPASAWLVIAGTAAAVAATVLALPRQPRGGPPAP